MHHCPACCTQISKSASTQSSADRAAQRNRIRNGRQADGEICDIGQDL